MARVLYTAEATVTGGRRSGHGRPPPPALRRSHFPDPPPTTLRQHSQPIPLAAPGALHHRRTAAAVKRSLLNGSEDRRTLFRPGMTLLDTEGSHVREAAALARDGPVPRSPSAWVASGLSPICCG